MNTTLGTNATQQKAHANSTGFLELINSFDAATRQGLADKQTSFTSVMKHHENDNSIIVCSIAAVCSDKSAPAGFPRYGQAGGV